MVTLSPDMGSGQRRRPSVVRHHVVGRPYSAKIEVALDVGGSGTSTIQQLMDAVERSERPEPGRRRKGASVPIVSGTVFLHPTVFTSSAAPGAAEVTPVNARWRKPALAERRPTAGFEQCQARRCRAIGWSSACAFEVARVNPDEPRRSGLSPAAMWKSSRSSTVRHRPMPAPAPSPPTLRPCGTSAGGQQGFEQPLGHRRLCEPLPEEAAPGFGFSEERVLLLVDGALRTQRLNGVGCRTGRYHPQRGDDGDRGADQTARGSAGAVRTESTRTASAKPAAVQATAVWRIQLRLPQDEAEEKQEGQPRHEGERMNRRIVPRNAWPRSS